MAYGSWGWGGVPKGRAFYEKSYLRKPLADWDARWHGLSAPARRAYLRDVKGPARIDDRRSVQPSVSAEKFDPGVLTELTGAGFVRVEPSSSKSKPARVVALDGAGAVDFARRVRNIQKYRLLDPREPGPLEPLLSALYYNTGLLQAVHEVLDKAGFGEFLTTEAEIRHCVANRRWPGWVAAFLNDPVAGRVVEAVRAAGEPVPLAGLPARVEGAGAAEVRGAVDKLVGYLGLVEDLDPTTLDVVVGLLPAVREAMARADAPRERPPLVACPTPKEFGPEGGLYVDDLRAVLLEVASEPPRLKQDEGLFAKEYGRFLAAIERVPAWFTGLTAEKDEERVEGAVDMAFDLELVETNRRGQEAHLHLSRKGREWLSADLKAQYAKVYESFRAPPSRDPSYDEVGDLGELFDDSPLGGFGLFRSYTITDVGFLGSDITAVKLQPAKSPVKAKGKAQGKGAGVVLRTPVPKVRDVQAVRESFGRALAGLPVGVFHTTESLVGHFTFGDANPLLLGRRPDEVRVLDGGRPVPPLEESLEAVGRKALLLLVMGRVLPLGAVRAAVDGEGRVCVATTRRLGAYFGLGPILDDVDDGAAGSRVVVQPDFSVVVIGTGTAALAELAPFCERTARGVGGGAAVLKITRESVVRAVGQGLTSSQILDRLRKHARPEPPANVVREIQEWSGRVRNVKAETLNVVRCPDRETADRVASALKRKIERLGETVLALGDERLTPAEKKKLKEQGVLVGGSAAPPARAGWRRPW